MSGLRKAKKYDYKDSNMAKVGTAEDREVKKASAETEPAWEGAGQQVGLEVWRIVKFKVHRVPKEDYGQFYSGDSYIILNTYKERDSDKLLWDVHFWIGKYSTQDEYGTAAYKTVELDTLLDDGPVQHREVQGHESALFRSYFKYLQLLEGGADSGFRHVETKEYKPRLLHFHGKGKNIKVKEVSVAKASLDPTDVFLLDQGISILIWQGPESNQFERHNAIGYAQKLGADRKRDIRVEVMGEDEDLSSKLSGEHEDPEEDSDDEDDSESFTPTLFRLTDRGLSDGSGKMQFSKVKEGGVSRDDFKSDDVFIYDIGKEVFCWVGEKTSRAEKQEAMSYAHSYLIGTQHSLSPISCIKEKRGEKEPKVFRMALTA